MCVIAAQQQATRIYTHAATQYKLENTTNDIAALLLWDMTINKCIVLYSTFYS